MLILADLFAEVQSIDTFSIINLLVAVVSLAVSGVALYHTYSVNKSFAKNQLIIDQVKIVSELVNYLNKRKIEVRFWTIDADGTSKGGRSGNITLFELLAPSSQQDSFDDAPVLLDSNRCNEPFEFLKYINDPLLPASIAQELRKFMNGRIFQVEPYSAYAGEAVVVMDSHTRYDYAFLQYTDDELRNKVIKPNAVALQSWLSFKTCGQSLRNEIDRWLKSKKIHELNIRTDFQPY